MSPRHQNVRPLLSMFTSHCLVGVGDLEANGEDDGKDDKEFQASAAVKIINDHRSAASNTDVLD